MNSRITTAYLPQVKTSRVAVIRVTHDWIIWNKNSGEIS